MSTPTQNYPVPEIEKSPAITKPVRINLSVVFNNWPIWLIIIVAAVAGWVTFNNSSQDLQKTFAAVGAVIGIAGIWFAYVRLVMSYEQQLSSMYQRERHHQEMLDFYKKKASQDIITEWYKEFMQKSFVVRNFRIANANALNSLDLGKIKIALEQAEEEELELIRKNDIKTTSATSEDKFPIRKNVIPILNYFEKISVCVLNEGADEEMLKEYFTDSFLVYQQAFQPLIDMRRTTPHNSTPKAFENFLIVVRRWHP
ncbi:DUF4760 domain-containing protein [Spirosoma aerophilum]